MPENDIILLRVGEIFLKGKNRGVFYKQLVRNARGLLGDLEGVEVEPMYLRAAVVHPPELEQACISRLGRLFGLSSLSPATAVARAMDSIPPRRPPEPSGHTCFSGLGRSSKRTPTPARKHPPRRCLGLRSRRSFEAGPDCPRPPPRT